MTLSDEITLREEIKEISDKIDAIINTVNEYYPMEQTSSSKQDETSDQPDS